MTQVISRTKPKSLTAGKTGTVLSRLSRGSRFIADMYLIRPHLSTEQMKLLQDNGRDLSPRSGNHKGQSFTMYSLKNPRHSKSVSYYRFSKKLNEYVKLAPDRGLRLAVAILKGQV